MKHLTRNVCDGCAVWCHFDPADWERPREFYEDKADHYADGYTHKPSEATCVRCLEMAERYGDDCTSRICELTNPERDLSPWQ